MRLFASLWGWVAIGAALTALFWLATPPRLQTPILNLASLAGILLLAVPTIRVNEQGRLIERVRSLQAGIKVAEDALGDDEALTREDRARHTGDLHDRKTRLGSTLDDLLTGKGAWTPAVNGTLYGGYVLLLGSSLSRVLMWTGQ